MPTGLPSDLYSGGAVKFDTQPYINFYAQTKARQQAKDEALDQYYQNQFKNVNPAGARTQDLPQFTEKVNEWQKFYYQNKDNIRNPRKDGGKAASEFQSRLIDAQNYIQQSKNEAKVTQDVMPLLRDPDKRSRIPDSVITDLATHDLPLNDPNRKSFDFSKLNFDAKPFDVTMQKNYLQGVQQGLKMDEAITGIKKNPNDFTQTVTTTASFGDEAKGAIRNRAAGAYGSDPSFKHFVDTELSKPNNYQQLNSIFKKQYGVDIAHPEDLATAWSLGAIQDQQTKQKTEDDWKSRQDYLQGQRNALLDKRLAAEKAGKKDEGGWINEYVGVLKEQSLGGPKIPFKYKNGTTVQEYDIPMDATLSKLLEKQGLQPDYLRYNPQNGKFRPIYAEHYTDDKGKRTTEIVKTKDGKFQVDETLSQPLSEPQLVLALGGRVTPTQRTTEMKRSLENQQSKSGYKLNGKTYSKKELNDLGYDDDEIEQFIKGGLIQQ
jgi:hypothetical protein